MKTVKGGRVNQHFGDRRFSRLEGRRLGRLGGPSRPNPLLRCLNRTTRGAVPPQNPVDRTIVDVSVLGVKLADLSFLKTLSLAGCSPR